MSFTQMSHSLALHRNIKGALVFILFIFVLTGCGKVGLKQKKNMPSAVNGIIDLTDWDFSKDGPVRLAGKWEFYWQQLLEPGDFESGDTHDKAFIQVPGPWTKHEANGVKLPQQGYGTYRLIIKSNVINNNSLAFKYKWIESSCRIWVNKNPVFGCGNVATNSKDHYGQIKPRIIPISLNNQYNEIIVQVSNYRYDEGGFIVNLLLGETIQLADIKEQNIFLDIFAFSSILIMGLYHFIWFITIREDKSTLFFSFICVLISIRVLLMGEMLLYSFLPDTCLCRKLSTFTLSMGLFFMVMFIHSLFPGETPLWFVRSVQGASGFYSVIVLTTPEIISILVYSVYEFIALAAVVYMAVIVLTAVFHKRTGAVLVLSAFCILFTACINDLLTQWGIFRTGYYIPQGFILFIYVQAFMLAGKFSNSFQKVKVLSTRLLSLDRLKDQFLANTSHELKTPLNGIVGIAQSMLDGASGDLDEEKKYNLRLITLSGKRLYGLVNDILDFSKLKNSDVSLQKKPVDVKQTVNMVMALLESTNINKSLVFYNNIPEDLPMVEADENRLEQIMFNLAGNAVKFTEKGSIVIDANVKEGLVNISVKDTGIGIPSEKIRDIFQSFEQGEGSISRKYGGTGLGLSITKKLIELHGGNIRVSSIPGEGSVFSFSLPVSMQQPPQINTHSENLKHDVPGNIPAGLHQKKAPSHWEKILAVDDDPVNLQVIINVLSAHEYNILTAYNGKDALEVLKEYRQDEISLIILDIMMPQMSGFELCRIIREKYSQAALPVLMLTAKNQPGDIHAGFEAGANDYLEKPFEKEELLARVQSLIAIRKLIVNEEKLLKSELRTLQAQIKPHFLFNVLNTVIHMCRVSPEKALSLLTHLNIYLQCSFSFKNDEEFISLKQEIKHVVSYLKIEKVRFRERLQVELDINEEIECSIPPLILQPIVENAVKHGLLPQLNGGIVKITTKIIDNVILLIVEDNGAGMPEEKIVSILQGEDKSAGIGVANVNRRLIKLYGEGLQIESLPEYGTTVTIKIPVP